VRDTLRCACRRAWPARSSRCACSARRGVDKDERALPDRARRRSSVLPRTATTNARSWSVRCPQPSARTAATDQGGRRAGPKGARPGAEDRREAVLGEFTARPVAPGRGQERQGDAGRRGAEEGSSTSSSRRWRSRFEDKVEKLQRGDELPPGVDEDGQGLRRREAQASARRQDGRPPRQQGRHLQILPVEDMPHLEDGTSVDIVLNPLGVMQGPGQRGQPPTHRLLFANAVPGRRREGRKYGRRRSTARKHEGCTLILSC